MVKTLQFFCRSVGSGGGIRRYITELFPYFLDCLPGGVIPEPTAAKTKLLRDLEHGAAARPVAARDGRAALECRTVQVSS
jgi:hypothetical protein